MYYQHYIESFDLGRICDRIKQLYKLRSVINEWARFDMTDTE